MAATAPQAPATNRLRSSPRAIQYKQRPSTARASALVLAWILGMATAPALTEGQRATSE